MKGHSSKKRVAHVLNERFQENMVDVELHACRCPIVWFGRLGFGVVRRWLNW